MPGHDGAAAELTERSHCDSCVATVNQKNNGANILSQSEQTQLATHKVPKEADEDHKYDSVPPFAAVWAKTIIRRQYRGPAHASAGPLTSDVSHPKGSRQALLHHNNLKSQLIASRPEEQR